VTISTKPGLTGRLTIEADSSGKGVRYALGICRHPAAQPSTGVLLAVPTGPVPFMIAPGRCLKGDGASILQRLDLPLSLSMGLRVAIGSQNPSHLGRLSARRDQRHIRQPSQAQLGHLGASAIQEGHCAIG